MSRATRFSAALALGCLVVLGSGIATAVTRSGSESPTRLATQHEISVLLAETGTIPRSHPIAAPPAGLGRAPTTAMVAHLAERRQYEAADVSTAAALNALEARLSANLVGDTNGVFSGPDSPDSSFNVFEPRRLPADISYAALEFAVAPTGPHRCVVGVYALAAPQPPRPAAEIVPLSVSTVALTWIRRSGDPRPRHRTVTGAAAARLIAEFDALPVDTATVSSCPALFGQGWIATFTSGTVVWRATYNGCSLGVTEDGSQLPELAHGPFVTDLQRALRH
jgi:hypothetical protein